MFEKKLEEISRIISSKLSHTETLNLISELNTALLPLSDDGEIIEVDENERMVKGKIGNRLNRLEIVINEDSLLSDETKKQIIDLIEEIRLFYGRNMVRKDHEIAEEIRRNSGI